MIQASTKTLINRGILKGLYDYYMTCNYNNASPHQKIITTMKKTNIKRKVVGGVLGVVLILCFTVGSVTVQALDRLIPAFQLNLIRITGLNNMSNIHP